jgi:hypothetical protein
LERCQRKAWTLTSVADDRQAIEALARRLQALPADIRWAYSQQDVIQAAAKGVAFTPGARTAQISRFLKLAARFGCEIIATKLASLVLLVAIRRRQSRVPAMAGQRYFFVGIDALREAELILQFEAMSGAPATVIDQRFAGALAAIHRPSGAELLRAWRDAARPIFAHLASDHGVAPLDRLYVLSFLVRRLHHYAHFLAVFRWLNASSPGAAVAFSSADLPAFAAVRAGIEAIYFSHGFHARSLVFPDFSRVVGFNAPEAEHVQSRLPTASVSWSPPVIRPLPVVRRLAVVGDYGEKLARGRELIEFCRAAGIDVVARPHPADHSGYWSAWHDVRGVRVDRDGTFDEFLERHRPCVMATWYSTTIYDALMRGVVPVTLEADQPDIVFPLADVALAWPEQRAQIQIILADAGADARYNALANALSGAIGAAHARSAMQKIRQLDEARELIR